MKVKKDTWNQEFVNDEMRKKGWQLIEADIWVSPRENFVRVCFQDGTMVEYKIPKIVEKNS